MTLIYLPGTGAPALCWLALLAGGPGLAHAAPARPLAGDSVLISGVVKKPSGVAARRRVISLGGVGAHGDTEFQTTTDGQGRFRFMVAADSLQHYPGLACLYVPKLGWNFQTASADVAPPRTAPQTYVLQLKKRSKLARWWSLCHPAY